MSAAPLLAPKENQTQFESAAMASSGPTLEAMSDKVDAHIQSSPALRLAVMDVQRYDEVLVILANGLMSPSFIRLALEPHWKGPIEVYDAGSMFGAAAND